jgi:dolichol-phosphate mannosyltransferase
MEKGKDLTLIMPVYNEDEIIVYVLKDWVENLDKLGIDYVVRAYNDGSRDSSLAVMQEYAKDNSQVEIIDKKNSGHGPTILRGYREANSEWVFHIDSDNEMKAKHFFNLWNDRTKFDFLMGYRANREQPLPRKLVSMFSRMTVKLFYGNKGPRDVNSPYRLLKKSTYENLFKAIPDDTFAPNVIIAGYTAKKQLKFNTYPVPIKFRETGEVSIKKWNLLKVAFKSWVQTMKFSFRI